MRTEEEIPENIESRPSGILWSIDAAVRVVGGLLAIPFGFVFLIAGGMASDSGTPFAIAVSVIIMALTLVIASGAIIAVIDPGKIERKIPGSLQVKKIIARVPSYGLTILMPLYFLFLTGAH